jgi:hypothetical protein
MLDKLRDGSKTQTIRLPRKRSFKVGDKVYIYWHPRQRDCQKLGEGIITKIGSKTPSQMTNIDAKLDGFEDDSGSFALTALTRALHRMHPGSNEFTLFNIITWEWTSRELDRTKCRWWNPEPDDDQCCISPYTYAEVGDKCPCKKFTPKE